MAKIKIYSIHGNLLLNSQCDFNYNSMGWGISVQRDFYANKRIIFLKKRIYQLLTITKTIVLVVFELQKMQWGKKTL